jgi:AraC family transcriptional regulator
MTLQITERAPVRLITLRHVGPYGEPVGRFWRETFMPWVQAAGWTDRSQYGIGRDDPRSTAPEACRYDVGIEAHAGEPVPAGAFFETTLPGGRTAVQAFHGTPATIGAAMHQLLFETLPAHDLEIAGSPFEHYPPGGSVDPATGAFSCELCVPVRPRTGG